MPVDVLHLLAVATWLGGLATLLVVARTATPGIERAAVLRLLAHRASAAWPSSPRPALYQSWRQVGTWSALVDTTYGQLLLVKVGLVAVLVGTASLSRRWTARLSEHAAPERRAPPLIVEQRASEPEPVTVPDDGKDAKRAAQLARQQAAMSTAREKRIRDADPERTGLRRTVLAEAGIAVVLLAVTTVLTTTEPGRTQEAVDRAKAGSAGRRRGPAGRHPAAVRHRRPERQGHRRAHPRPGPHRRQRPARLRWRTRRASPRTPPR